MPLPSDYRITGISGARSADGKRREPMGRRVVAVSVSTEKLKGVEYMETVTERNLNNDITQVDSVRTAEETTAAERTADGSAETYGSTGTKPPHTEYISLSETVAGGGSVPGIRGAETYAATETAAAVDSSQPADLGTVEGLLLIIAVMIAVIIGIMFSNIFFKRGGD